jgi:hypothetical protein
MCSHLGKNVSPKLKTMEEQGVRAHSLARSTIEG